MPAVIGFDVFIIIVVVVVIIILGLDILCCGHRHLSRCAVASLFAPTPLSPRLHIPIGFLRNPITELGFLHF